MISRNRYSHSKNELPNNIIVNTILYYKFMHLSFNHLKDVHGRYLSENFSICAIQYKFAFPFICNGNQCRPIL